MCVFLTASILEAQVGKPPNVAKANDLSSYGQNELPLVGPLSSLLVLWWWIPGATVLRDELWLVFGLHLNSHYSALDVTVQNSRVISKFRNLESIHSGNICHRKLKKQQQPKTPKSWLAIWAFFPSLYFHDKLSFSQ